MILPAHIGFTGTQQGMTGPQRERVYAMIHARDFYAHHGDCVGADAEFHALARLCPRLRGVVVHPSTLTAKRAWCATESPRDAVLEPKPPLDRNHDIVNACPWMLATPRTMIAQVRSGTWTTIRYAKTLTTPMSERCLIIVNPDGSYFQEGNLTWIL